MADKEKKKDYAREIADIFIKQLREGTAPWVRSWKPGQAIPFPHNPTTDKPYRGGNALWLMAQAEARGSTDSRWMTFRQAKEAGMSVRKGEKGTYIQYWLWSGKEPVVDDKGQTKRDDAGAVITRTVRYERPRVFGAIVFNGIQIDGIQPETAPLPPPEWERHEKAQNILDASQTNVRHVDGNRAYYTPHTDQITLPEQAQFPDANSYYETALHELGHWTGHSSRLDRDLSNPFGSEGYAREELRAEIASFMMGCELGLGHDPSRHASYVDHWIHILENDPREILRACNDAEQAKEFVLGLTREQTRTAETEPVQHLIADAQTTDTPRTVLAVPYTDRKAAKTAGAQWDRVAKTWYAPAGVDLALLAAWCIDNSPAHPPITPPSEKEDFVSVATRATLSYPFDARQELFHPVDESDAHLVAVHIDHLDAEVQQLQQSMSIVTDLAEARPLKERLTAVQERRDAFLAAITKAAPKVWKRHQQNRDYDAFMGINKTSGEITYYPDVSRTYTEADVRRIDDLEHASTALGKQAELLADRFDRDDEQIEQLFKRASDLALERAGLLVNILHHAPQLWITHMPVRAGVSVGHPYTIERGIVCIEDSLRGPPIENNPRAVIKDLLRQGVDLDTHPVIYRDRDGIWERLIIVDNTFADYEFCCWSHDKQTTLSDLQKLLTAPPRYPLVERAYTQADIQHCKELEKRVADLESYSSDNDYESTPPQSERHIEEASSFGDLETQRTELEALQFNIQHFAPALWYEHRTAPRRAVEGDIVRPERTFPLVERTYTEADMRRIEELEQETKRLSSLPTKDEGEAHELDERADALSDERRALIFNVIHYAPDLWRAHLEMLVHQEASKSNERESSPEHVLPTANTDRSQPEQLDMRQELFRSLGKSDALLVARHIDRLDTEALQLKQSLSAVTDIAEGRPLKQRLTEVQERRDAFLSAITKAAPDEWERYQEERNDPDPFPDRDDVAFYPAVPRTYTEADVRRIDDLERLSTGLEKQAHTLGQQLGRDDDQVQQLLDEAGDRSVERAGLLLNVLHYAPELWRVQLDKLAQQEDLPRAPSSPDHVLGTMDPGEPTYPVVERTYTEADAQRIDDLHQQAGQLDKQAAALYAESGRSEKVQQLLDDAWKLRQERGGLLLNITNYAPELWMKHQEKHPPLVQRTILAVPYSDRDQAKTLGAQWDKQNKVWFVPSGTSAESFAKWVPPSGQRLDIPARSDDPVRLAVPYNERDVAKALGARWTASEKTWYAPPGTPLQPLSKWIPPAQSLHPTADIDPQKEFAEALNAAGLRPDAPIAMDGTMHRVPIEDDKPGDRSGAYVGHLDGHPAGFIQNHKTGVRTNWKSSNHNTELSQADLARLQQEAAERRQQRQAALAEQYDRVAKECIVTFLNASTDDTHPYLRSKGIGPFACSVLDDKLLVPICDTSGHIRSLQCIAPDGTKSFVKGGELSGHFSTVSRLSASEADVIIISEGLATALTVNELYSELTAHDRSTQPLVSSVVAFTASNLVTVAKKIHEVHPNVAIYIAADNDHKQEAKGKPNVGREKAEEAARVVGGQVLKPTFPSDSHGSDWNDLVRLSGRDAAKEQFAKELTRAELNIAATAAVAREKSTPTTVREKTASKTAKTAEVER